VYDALSSDRPYRAGMVHELCLDVLRQDAAGGGLDPDIVERFCAIPAHLLAVPADAKPVSRVIPAPAQREAALSASS
jgi:HD-GYP domain-containing protein (c-di-GMP phosphodiesterase class II)